MLYTGWNQGGLRIIESLEPGDYTKEQLIVSISGALLSQGGLGT
jgi:hypothetical protein